VEVLGFITSCVSFSGITLLFLIFGVIVFYSSIISTCYLLYNITLLELIYLFISTHKLLLKKQKQSIFLSL